MELHETEQPFKISGLQAPVGPFSKSIFFIFLFWCLLIPACTGICIKQKKVGSGKKIVIPEYSPASGVVISESLLDEKLNKYEFVASLLSKGKVYVYCYPVHSEINIEKLKKYIVSAYGEQHYESIIRNLVLFDKNDSENKYNSGWDTSVWSRDWGPISFYSGGDLKFADFKYYLGRKYEDLANVALSRSNYFNNSVLDVTIYYEGGNFMNDSAGNCYVTDKIISNNRNINFDPVIVRDVINKQLSENIGCNSIIFFPTMPFEKTGHIDIWAKLISDKIILVAELYDWQKELLSFGRGNELAATISIDAFESIQKFLERRANEFKDIGLTVYRVPMPIPYQVSTNKGDHRYIFRTYVNSFFYNTGNNTTLYIPQYLNPYIGGSVNNHYQYPDQQFIVYYEDKLYDVLTRINSDFDVNIKPFRVLSDDLITGGGAVHCVVMQIPRNPD